MSIESDGLESSIRRKADDSGINPAIIAFLDYGLPIGTKSWWWPPEDIDDSIDVFAKNIDILGGHSNVLSNFVESLATSIQFPRSTAYLHGLAVVSAAMVESFFYRFNGSYENTVAIYTVGAQPPSTGKSAIDQYLTHAVHAAYTEKRKAGDIMRVKIKRKIAGIEKDLKKAGDNQAEVLVEQLSKEHDELRKYPDYLWCVNDPTPEGCERVIAQNNGFFNVVSDESAAVKVILGLVYGDTVSNNGVFLKAWDNGYLAVARSTREGFNGRVRGAMAVLAQDASVEAILEAGQAGEGVSERFLIIREKNLLGKRVHTNYTPIDTEAMREYEVMIRNIVTTPGSVTFFLTPEAERLVRDVKQEQEPSMADGGKYSSPMLRGVVGKNEKQIIKLAAILHCIENWKSGGKRSHEIQLKSIMQAVTIFNQLLETYVAAADSKGYTGETTELKKLVAALRKYAGKGTLKISLQKLRDNIKNSPPFNTQGNLTKKLKADYLPNLQKLAYIVMDDVKNEIYINPWLKD